MFELLSPEQYPLARTIFASLRYHLMVDSIVDGITPGRIFIDQIETPRAALMWDRRDRILLAGNHDDQVLIAELREILHNQILPQAIENGVAPIWIQFLPLSWGALIEDLIGDLGIETTKRRFYTSSKEKLNWRALVPDGFQTQLIDHQLLQGDPIRHFDKLEQAIISHWGTWDAYLGHGWGYVLMTDKTVVSWCFTAYVSMGHYEFCVETLPEHRRHGYATLIAAVCVDHSMKNSWTSHWHCWEQDLAAIRIAQKIGFEIPMGYSVIRFPIIENL